MKNLTANVNTLCNFFISLMLAFVLGIPVQVEAGMIQLISINNNGEQANGNSSQPFISDNGRFVAFKSEASNLVEGDTNEVADIFVYDLLEHKIERVSVDSNGNEVFSLSDRFGGGSYSPSISADGHYVTFLSSADNLISEYSYSDVFVHNRENGSTQRISGNNKNYKGTVIRTPMISANGKYVVFSADYSPIDKESIYKKQWGLFLHELDSGITGFVECRSCDELSISGDGRFIAFNTLAKYIPDVHPKNSLRNDVFVYDRVKYEFIRIGFDNDGNETENGSSRAKISTNGRYVAFDTYASDFIDNDTNGRITDTFVHDLQTRLTTIISLDNNGNQIESTVQLPPENHKNNGKPISGDGRYVILCGRLTDEGGCYIHDVQTNENTRLPGGGEYSISGDGRYIAFPDSRAIVENDTNGVADIFVYDMDAGSVVTISGKIRSPDNQALANVALCLDDIDSCETSTNATGSFTLTRELRNSLYLITPQQTKTSGALKFTPKSRWLNVTGKPIENINFIATPYDPNPHIYVSTNAMQFSTENPNIDVDIRMDFEGDEPIEKFYDVYVVVGAVGAPVETMLFHAGQSGWVRLF